MTQVLNVDPRSPQIENIIRAAEVLKKGGLVAFPTETVYGLAASFFDKKAIEKLYEVKQRPKDKPFTAHIADLDDLSRFECEINSFARELIVRFWPGPITLIFNTKKSGKVGFRMPNHNIAQELIRQSGTIIAAPSANLSGQAPPKNAGEVLAQLKDKIDMVLDGGETQIGKESTVIDLTVFPYKILREAAISRDKIAETEFNFWKNKISPTIKKILFVCTGNSCRSVMAQGYLKKRLRQIERDDVEVYSRGITAPLFPGPTPETLEVLKTEGIDMSAHKPTGLTDQDIKDSDLILVMEEFQRDEIIEKAPSKMERVYLLTEFGLWGGRVQDAPLEVRDPIGKPVRIYKDAFNVIKNSVERLIKILI